MRHTAVLVADMTHHFKLTTDLAAKNAFDVEKLEDRKMLVNTVVHSADLANPVLPPERSVALTLRVTQEFKRQAETERELGLPVTKFMDITVRRGPQPGGSWPARRAPDSPPSQGPVVQDNKEVAKMNAGFIEFVVTPLWRALHEFFPELDVCMSAWRGPREGVDAVSRPDTRGVLREQSTLTKTSRSGAMRNVRAMCTTPTATSWRRRRTDLRLCARGRAQGLAQRNMSPFPPPACCSARLRESLGVVHCRGSLAGCPPPASDHWHYSMEGTSRPITAHLALVPSRTCYVSLPAPARAAVMESGVCGPREARAARFGR